MIDRYPTTAGCRLDTGDGTTGPAVDLNGYVQRQTPDRTTADLWVRNVAVKA
jgi:hypothetical protein